MKELQIKEPDFAYLIGVFMADGCFYLKEKKYYAFEFYDGTSVKNELKYSLKHLNNIKRILSNYFRINLHMRKRGNLYVLYFKSKEFGHILIKCFNINPGKKALIVDLPKIYKKTSLEKYFWLGFMDCDGMVARNSRKVVLDVCAKKLINSFKTFLLKENIGFKYSERIINKRTYFRVTIPSFYIRDYYKKLSFTHPRKKLWIEKHVKKEFYKRNIINFNKLYKNNYLDYKKFLFNTNAYVENGLDLIKKYKIINGFYRNRKNVKFSRLYKLLESKGLNKKSIYKNLSNFKLKMGKGSKYSVILPYKFNKNLYEISRIVRPIPYGLIISRNYSKLLNLDYNKIIFKINKIFKTKPTFTGKGEPIYPNGVLGIFFARAIRHPQNLNTNNLPIKQNVRL
ncbi:MAG: hypothetical protein AABX55_01395 [Nanoarchaeota archaeon]